MNDFRIVGDFDPLAEYDKCRSDATMQEEALFYADKALDCLKVCGTCAHWDCVFDTYYCNELPSGHYGFAINATEDHDPCHLTPSHWAPYWREGGESS